MNDADRPAASGTARLRAVRGGVRTPRPAAFGTGDVARRLAALERQVEEALARSGVALPASAQPMVRGTLDEAVAVYAHARRWLAEATEWVAPDGAIEASLAALYRWWWRVDAVGLERIPRTGRVLLVVNRAGVLLPYDALMVHTALQLAGPDGRATRVLVDDWLTDLPIVGRLLGAAGAKAVTPATVRAVLQAGDAAIAFPEGRDAALKPYARRYRVQPFGRSRLLRLAVETGTPIVPVAVIGAEEVAPVLWRLEALGRAVGLPAVPITPTFPWLGALGLVPLPTKWTLHVGDPLDVAAHYPPATARDTAAMRRVRDQVRERLQGLVSEGLRRRRSIFWG